LSYIHHYTLQNIEPTDSIEVYSRSSLHSLRSNGTFIQLLNRPTRYLETSRGYVHGDPINFIDWKVYARTEDLTIREQKDESSALVKMTGDISNTMQWPTKNEISSAGLGDIATKAETCLRLMLNLAYQHIASGDRAEIVLFTSEGLKGLSLRTTSDVMALYNLLLTDGFDEKTLSKYYVEAKETKASAIKVEYYFTDMISGDYSHTFSSAKFKILVHVLSSLENNIGWIRSSNRLVDDLDDPSEYDGGTIQKKYSKSMKQWCQKIKADMALNEVETVLVDESLSITDYSVRLAEAVA
jgi:hypothetical protein